MHQTFPDPNYGSPEEELIELAVPQCGCSKRVPRLDPTPDGHHPPDTDTDGAAGYTERNGTCANATWARGFGQKGLTN